MSRKEKKRCAMCGEYANSRHSCRRRKALSPGMSPTPLISEGDSPSPFSAFFSLFSSAKKETPAGGVQQELFPDLPSRSSSKVKKVEDAPTPAMEPLDVWRRAEEEGLLPLFATPTEILAKFEPLEGDRTRPLESLPIIGDRFLFRRKLREAHVAVIGRAPLYDRVQEEGVTTAVCLQWTLGNYRGIRSIVNGHHRLVSRQEQGPDEPIPVAFFPTLEEAFDFEEEPNEQWKESLRKNPAPWF